MRPRFGAGHRRPACAILRPGVCVTLVERDPALADLARANAALNGVAAEVIEADVLAPGREREAAGLTPDRFDCVLTNPPFFEEGRYRPSPDAAKASAHGFRPRVSTAGSAPARASCGRAGGSG